MKSIVCLVVLTLMAFTVTEAVYGPEFRMKNIFKGPPLPVKRSDLDLVNQWIDQRIDNFDALNLVTYRMVV